MVLNNTDLVTPNPSYIIPPESEHTLTNHTIDICEAQVPNTKIKKEKSFQNLACWSNKFSRELTQLKDLKGIIYSKDVSIYHLSLLIKNYDNPIYFGNSI